MTNNRRPKHERKDVEQHGAAAEPEAVSERADWQAGHLQAQVGHGLSRFPICFYITNQKMPKNREIAYGTKIRDIPVH